ncbi:hypothetical protein AN639_08745 [Candidatus Epulonipiscium fishelsonii]|uniref:Uncharacterized protein n=1 Tax=Candidatus Epulonipiscium fishelsonii TaxID=77094 RepID=A0ACC8XF55_9FIRM|nr:hypothetical protein AN639_08745 [Epulopiscium sp. SCG-B05WGA-EpuloA1]ONI41955.1 hypothetical protein AN396_02645 [Epulopiscium sp. SCG-B11WGA-EpuloA1]
MAGIIYDLVDILEQQKECYEGLYTLATYKTQAIVNKEINFLQDVVNREEEFLGRMAILDKKREETFNDIALVTGLNPKTITITIIIQKMGENLDVSKTLVKLREDLLGVIKKVKRENDQNKLLLEQSIEFVNFSLNAIKSTKFTPMEHNYTKASLQQSLSQSLDTISMFDSKR